MKKFYVIIGVMTSLIIVLFSALLITNRPIKGNDNALTNTMPAPKYYTVVEEGPLDEVINLETRVEFNKSKKISIEVDTQTTNSLLYNVGDIIEKGEQISTLSDYITDKEYYFDSYDLSKNKLYIHLLPTDSYSVDIAIPQIYTDMFVIGDNAKIYYNRKVYNSTIVKLDNKISSNNTLKATLTIDTDDKLIYNSNVIVTLKYAVKDNVVFVDNGVVMFDGFKHFVYLIDRENEKVKEVTITIGEKTNSYTEVKSGLSVGDVIGRFYE